MTVPIVILSGYISEEYETDNCKVVRVTVCADGAVVSGDGGGTRRHRNANIERAAIQPILSVG